MGTNSQRAKLILEAFPYELTDNENDYYLKIRTQKVLYIEDLAREVAAQHGHHNEAEIAMLTTEVLELANWYLSNGYSVSTPQGIYRTNVQGVVLDTDLSSAPNRDKITLSVSYTMSSDMKQRLDEAELDVEINKSTVGPKLYGVADARQIEQSKLPDAETRVPIPVEAGQTAIIRGKGIKVGGTGSDIGVTLTRTDDDSGETLFFPLSKLYPNTPSQVGFVLPATVETGSTWQVTLCTQLGSNSSRLLKSPRTVTMENTFTVGETTTPAPTPGGGEEEGEEEGGGGQAEDPLA